MRPRDAQVRAALSEQAVLGRFSRRLWAIPRTRVGVVGWPATTIERLALRWHYWWQAHLLDCLVDAELRSPSRARARLAKALVRGNLIRNGFGFTNRYYDDMAWWALALHRANQTFGARYRLGPILRACRAAIRPDGAIPWRRGDSFLNAPANGPVAILLARTGHRGPAGDMAEWVHQHLLLDSGLIADGVVEKDNQFVRDETLYTYCQGVMLGAELELDSPQSAQRVENLVQAVSEHLAKDGVIVGHGGGDGGLFSGILARYLALVATRASSAGARRMAAGLILASADAAWEMSTDPGDGWPLFGHQWNLPAVVPRAGRVSPDAGAIERDLSVQLSGWMLMESAALLGRR